MLEEIGVTLDYSNIEKINGKELIHLGQKNDPKLESKHREREYHTVLHFEYTLRQYPYRLERQ